MSAGQFKDKGTVLEICGDVRVALPGDIRLMTTYVLLEQQDWFEDEIRFVRQLVRPGQCAVDIGANYGLYALTFARKSGDSGKIIAIEPASETAAYLRESVAQNGFANMQVVQAALSDRSGIARLQLGPNSELNRLDERIDTTGRSEQVEVRTLDSLDQDFDITHVDFLKIDAEGEEARIIRGGSEFLRKHSPLVMYEIKAGEAINLDLLSQFFSLGYASYRLMPGINILVPVGATERLDPYTLNLFCCKPDRAALLERGGDLAMENRTPHPPPDSDAIVALLSAMPYARSQLGEWFPAGSIASVGMDVRMTALGHYAAAHATGNSACARYSALQAACRGAQALCADTPCARDLSTLSRIAWESGERALAVASLSRALKALGTEGGALRSVPYLPASPHFDRIDPSGRDAQWLVASLGLVSCSAELKAPCLFCNKTSPNCCVPLTARSW